jgi:hypothetical protein
MKIAALSRLLLPALLLLGAGCDQYVPDAEPEYLRAFQLFPDEVYMYNGGAPDTRIRFDPLINDSIRTTVRVSYSQPGHGRLELMADGGTYYIPDKNFYGLELITYTVCSDRTCASQEMLIIVEPPPDATNCVTTLGADSLQTTRNTPKSIRILLNDVICAPQRTGISVFKPEKGTFSTVSYSGSLKNTIYIYTPPKDFTGRDSFRYRVHPDPDRYDQVYLEAVVHVNVQ